MRITLLLMMFITFSPQSQTRTEISPKDEIWIGETLHLGMSKSIVISRLAENNNLVKVQGAGDNWLVNPKGETNVSFGMLGFQNDKLTYISKDWTQGNEDAPAFAQALHTAFDGFANEDRTTCTVSAPVTRSSVAEMKYIIFSCGAKRLQILHTRIFSGAYQGERAQINEILSSETKR
jgi:hypothetical protein